MLTEVFGIHEFLGSFLGKTFTLVFLLFSAAITLFILAASKPVKHPCTQYKGDNCYCYLHIALLS